MNTSFPEPSYLLDLAKRDPDELERVRLREVNKLIESAPKHLQARLRGLQFQIDCKRRVHKSPLGSCIEISKMMLDSLHSLSEALQGEESMTTKRSASRAADVLDFSTSQKLSNLQHR